MCWGEAADENEEGKSLGEKRVHGARQGLLMGLGTPGRYRCRVGYLLYEQLTAHDGSRTLRALLTNLYRIVRIIDFALLSRREEGGEKGTSARLSLTDGSRVDCRDGLKGPRPFPDDTLIHPASSRLLNFHSELNKGPERYQVPT